MKTIIKSFFSVMLVATLPLQLYAECELYGDAKMYKLPPRSSEATSVVFSPDGSLLAVANDHNIAVFVVNEGILESGTTYMPYVSFSNLIAFSPDGAYLASVGRSLQGDPGDPQVAIFAINGTKLAALLFYK